MGSRLRDGRSVLLVSAGGSDARTDASGMMAGLPCPGADSGMRNQAGAYMKRGRNDACPLYTMMRTFRMNRARARARTPDAAWAGSRRPGGRPQLGATRVASPPSPRVSSLFTRPNFEVECGVKS